MAKRKSTKRTLLSSALALLLCMSMLVGSTFAWFTDSVTSSSNKIQAGTLQVDLELLENGKWNSIKDSKAPIFDYDLWEPGYTEVKVLKVENEGTLALKWVAKFTAQKELSKLAEVIDVYVCPSETELAMPADRDLTGYTKVGTLDKFINTLAQTTYGQLEAGKAAYLGIALKMQETAGNEYQGLDLGGEFDITIFATQYTSESDSFGNDYDTNAEFPSVLKPGQVSAPVTVIGGAVAEAITLEGDGISASVPAGVAVKSGTKSLTLSITPLEDTTSSISVTDEERLLPVDVHVEGVAEDNIVPIIINLGEVMPKYLNMGNYSLTHVEDGVSKPMTLVGSAAELTAHNTYTYDPATGVVCVAMASFSEVTLRANTTNAWQGHIADSFAAGGGGDLFPFQIANADQLARMNYLISNQKTYKEHSTATAKKYSDAYYQLIADIDLGGDKVFKDGKQVTFYPIGYQKEGEGKNKAGETWYTFGSAFTGTFDGNGHTISNLWQRTWDMDGDYDNGYWNDAMGLFGYIYNGEVKNLVINNFYSEGEFAPTGCVTAYAGGTSTFTNITIINSHPKTYNTGVAGIIGWDNGGKTEDTASDFKFNNITIDETTTVSALWGSWDVAAAGILGYLGTYSEAEFDNCHVAATIDVYNDVCGNYQYYWYRYCGAYIGTVDRRLDNGNGALDLSNVKATNCTVSFGDRHEYYYCEIIDNTTASYTHDYQMSRLMEIKAIDGTTITYLDGTTGTVPASGRANYVIVDYTKGRGTENATCYHFKDGAVWTHEMGGIQTGVDENKDGVDDLKEDKQAVYIPFRQLFGGYGWGVDGVDLGDYENIEIATVTKAVEKFVAKEGRPTTYEEDNYFAGDTGIELGTLFNAKDGAAINSDTVLITVSPADEYSVVRRSSVKGTGDWTTRKVELWGIGNVIVTISDYTNCLPTSIQLELTSSRNYFKGGDFETVNGKGPNLEFWTQDGSNFIKGGLAQVATVPVGNRADNQALEFVTTPTIAPSTSATTAPTVAPTVAPTAAPTADPTDETTEAPTAATTEASTQVSNPIHKTWTRYNYSLDVERNTRYRLSFKLKGAPIDFLINPSYVTGDSYSASGWYNLIKKTYTPTSGAGKGRYVNQTALTGEWAGWTEYTFEFTVRSGWINLNYIIAFARGGNDCNTGEVNPDSRDAEISTYIDDIVLQKILK